MGRSEHATSYIEIGHLNSDLVKGWRLSATLHLRTPLRVLEMHGYFHGIACGEPPAIADHEGSWTLVTKTYAELGIDMPEIVVGGRTTASDIGQIPVDGGKYLPFLKAVRAVVESDGSITTRVRELRTELAKPEWRSFCTRLGGENALCGRFFPDFLSTIPNLSAQSVWALSDAGLDTPARLASAANADLLAMKGIGPAKLKLIRAACEAAEDKDAELVDCVSR